MSDENLKNEVDFLPMHGIDNDFQKIYNEFDYKPTNHLTLHKLVTLINLPKGKHRLLPNIGLKEEFLKIYGMDLSLLSSHLQFIESEIKRLINLNTEISYKVVNDKEHYNSQIEIIISINSLPEKLVVTTQDPKKNVSQRLNIKLID